VYILFGRAGRSPWRTGGFSWSLENLHANFKKGKTYNAFLKREKNPIFTFIFSSKTRIRI
jgi:hypothetical protein